MRNLYNKIIIITSLIIVFSASFVSAYDHLVAHPKLTRAAVEVYNQSTDNRITKEQEAWIIKGAIEEDTHPRYVNHFYNPVTGKGLKAGLQYISAKDWAMNQSSISGNYDVETILDDYKRGNKERAYRGVGHILHLIQDMGVPAHVRDDEHGDGDPYEEWVEYHAGLSVENVEKIKINGIENTFDDLAFFTHDNFFSKDSLIVDTEKYYKKNEEFGGKIMEYYINKIEDEEYKIIEIDNKGFAPVFLVDSFQINQDYWKMLYPKVVGYSAGVIEWFSVAFENIDENREVKKVGFLRNIVNSFGGFIHGASQKFSYLLGSSFLVGGDVVFDSLGKIVDTGHEAYNFSGLVYQSGREVIDDSKQKINDEAEKSVVLLDKAIDKTSEGTQKTFEGAMEQIKVLGEEFVYRESEASTESITEANSGIGDTDWEEVELERVIDGDTIILKNGERVRYIGIDAPELNKIGPDDDECLAWVAKVRNEQLLKTGQIKLLKDKNTDKDKYGRQLRYVYVGDNFINASLAREGLAEIFFCEEGWENCPVTADKPRRVEIETANKLAQAQKRGIYSSVCLELEDEKIVQAGKNKSEDIIKNKEKINEIESPKKQKTVEDFIILHSSGTVEAEGSTQSEENQPISSEQDTLVSVSFFNLYDPETQNQEYTASTTVGINLEIKNKDLAETFCLSEEENYPEFTNPCWRGDIGDSYEFSSGDGLKKVYLFIRQGEDIITSYSTIYLDTERLKIYFVDKPAVYASSTEANFIMGANKEVIGEYSLDKASSTFLNIGEEVLFDDLAEGEHEFSYQGISINNEIASTSFPWLVDTIAPTVSLEVIKQSDDFSLSWLGEDLILASGTPSGIDFYNLFYQLASTSPWEVILEKTQATSTIFNLASSSEETIFGVEAIDRAGNKSKLSFASTSEEIVQEINHILISEVQFASEGSTKDEFIEIYNPTNEDINLFAYRLSRKTKSGNETNLLTEFPEAFLPAGGYYLITHEDYDGINPADSVYSTTQSIADDNTIILYSDAGDTVVDKLGVGEASDFEGEVFSVSPEKDFSLERKALVGSTVESIFQDREAEGNAYDSDNNLQDFLLQADPNPRGLNLAPEPKLLTDNLEYLWHFDECIGYEAFDIIQAGVIEDNFGWSEGVWGCSSALSKRGVTESEIYLPTDNGISLSFFLKVGVGMQTVALFSEDFNQEIKLGLAEGKLIFFDGANYQFVGYETDNSWHYFSLVLENNSIKIFVDAVLLDELVLENNFTNFTKLKIGEAGNINLDELAIWSRNLLEEEIEEIFNRTEMLEPQSSEAEEKIYEWKSGEATSTVMTELMVGDDLEIGESTWYHDDSLDKNVLHLASSSPLEKELINPITQKNFSLNYLFGHLNMGKNLDNSLLFSSNTGTFGFRLYENKIDVYINGEINTFDASVSAGLLSLVLDSEDGKFQLYSNGRLLGEGGYTYQNHEISSFQISAQEDNYMFYSLSVWDGILTTNQIKRLMMDF